MCAQQRATRASMGSHSVVLLCLVFSAAHAGPPARDTFSRLGVTIGMDPRCAFVKLPSAGLHLHNSLRPKASCPSRTLRRDAAGVLEAERNRPVERAALELAVAEQVEGKLLVQKAVELLKAQREEEVEKEEWDRILRKVENSVDDDSVEEPGPWELAGDLLKEADDVFGEALESPYMRIALDDNETGGVNLVGKMNELDNGSVQNAFDAVIQQQKDKQPKGLLSFLGLDSSSSGGGMPWRESTNLLPTNLKSYETRRAAIDRQIAEDYAFLVVRSEQLADLEYSQGRSRFARKGHKVPWELVQSEVRLLQSAILREGDPASGTSSRGRRAADVRQALRLPDTSAWMSGPSKDAPLDSSDTRERALAARTKGNARPSESKRVSRLLSSVLGTAPKMDTQKQGAATPPNASSVVVTLGFGGMDIKKGAMSSILQSELDWELASFRENVDAIRMSTEELIKDANRWRKEEERLPYASVTEFRAYVLHTLSNQSEAAQEAMHKGERQKDEGTLASSSSLSSSSSSSLSPSSLSAGSAGVERAVDMVGPWGLLESLLTPRENALQVMMERRGHDMIKTVALNATEMRQEDLRWASLDETAQSDWRFFSPEQYTRYQDMRAARLKTLIRRKERARAIALVSSEAEVSLDEFMGVMLDLGWAQPGVDLQIASLGRSALSGKGRELGMEPGSEASLKVSAYLIYAVLILWPVAPFLLPSWQVEQMMEVQTVMDLSTLGLERNVRWWTEAASPQGLASNLDLFFQGPSIQSLLSDLQNMMNN